MTSEPMKTSERRTGRNPMAWFRNLAKSLTLSSMLAVTGLSMAGGIACGEEEFKCCEGAFSCTDAMGAPVTFYWCDCPSGDTYTYEECGLFMKGDVTQAELDARALADAGLTGCMLPVTQGTVLAKNSCSPGWPVGDPP
jgi:hypothetical protein